MVRQAVLKGKDPSQLLDEMEKIDEMGNPVQKYRQNIQLIVNINVSF